jgi:hypothetical protein
VVNSAALERGESRVSNSLVSCLHGIFRRGNMVCLEFFPRHRATIMLLSGLLAAPAALPQAAPSPLDALGNIFRLPGAGTPAGAAPPQALESAPLSPTYAALFAKRTVTGDDLYETLKVMRLELRAKRSAAAWAKLQLAFDQTLTAQTFSGGFNPSALIGRVATTAVTSILKDQATIVATKTLDDYLQYLLDERRTALAEETITLPSSQGMSDAQAKRVITMATLIIGARVSGKILAKADEDFKSLTVDYKALIEQREKAATLMFATIDQRRAAQRSNDSAQKDSAEADLRRSLSEKDVSFIDQALNRMTLAEFSKDMAAQNLALEYLRSKSPSAFADYRTIDPASTNLNQAA